jgi:hypothetical protein
MTAALAPDHVADLQRSGLTTDVIDALQIAGVRPHDLKLPGVESAYALPYFNIDGKPTSFQRLKLFPPIRTADGHAQKYYQAPGTPPQLYMPPLFPWGTITKNPKCDLVVCEGEKKAAAACAKGKFAIGVAGVWNWRQRTDNGERLDLPTFDEFVWQGRTVDVVPDSDAWRSDKQKDVLPGFYALSQKLNALGATVRLIRLPDLHGTKTGLDDWLVAVGEDYDNLWPQLERLPLDEPRLASVAGWWQRWKEKQVTEEAMRAHHGDALEVAEVAGLYTVRSQTHQVRITFDRLTDQRGSVAAEVTVELGDAKLLSGVDLGLKSDSGQTKLASGLSKLATSVPWKLLLQKACAEVLQRHRQGDPPQHLTLQTTVEPLTYTINPLVFKKKITILYGDGGLGKSTLALMCGMCVSVGANVAGIAALRGRVLYLDYEDDADVHTRRLHAIVEGHPELAEAAVVYQRCVEPLTKLIYPLVRRIQAENITCVILDSLIAATGGDSSAEATAKLFAALRLLGVEVLALGHVPKTREEGQDRTTVYGSVFNQNFARSVWEIKKEQEIGEDGSIIGLFNRKSNLSRLHHPIGLKVTQNEAGTCVHYEPFDLSQASALEAALPLVNRIRNLLEQDGTPRTAKQIADALGENLRTVQTTLSRYNGTKWHKLGENRETLWTVLNR